MAEQPVCQRHGRSAVASRVRVNPDGTQETEYLCELDLAEERMSRGFGRSSLFDDFFSDFFGDGPSGGRLTPPAQQRQVERVDARSSSATRHASCSSAPPDGRRVGEPRPRQRPPALRRAPGRRGSPRARPDRRRSRRDLRPAPGGGQQGRADRRRAVALPGRESGAARRLRGVARPRKLVRRHRARVAGAPPRYRDCGRGPARALRRLAHEAPRGGYPRSGGRRRARETSTTPKLDEFGRDLTAEAREGKLDPVIGRADEIDQTIEILSRRTKNNPALLGEPGVGKTAIVEGIAQRIVNDEVPETLEGRRVVALDLAGMIAGTKYRGEFEERLKTVIDEIRGASEQLIVFIDELHTVVGAGAAEGAMDASNMLKPALARGELRCIGATTVDEYRKNVEKDPALERRFQPVFVREPTVDETIEILNGLRDRYEAFHRVRITEEAIIAAAELSDRYIRDR